MRISSSMYVWTRQCGVYYCTKPMNELLEKQLELYKTLLRSKRWPPDSPMRKEFADFIEQFPRQMSEAEQKEIRHLLELAFSEASLPSTQAKGSFDALIPTTGWFRDYHDYTLSSEPPTVFHFACALVALGASLGRNVFFDKGYYKVYTNTALVLIAPTGRCRKTSATNVALGLAREAGVNVLSEKVTPEALVTALGGSEQATGLVYAPELAVFLGRQKYLEGMVPLLTSLFDAPDTWTSTTVGRGKLKLQNVALSMLGASTIEWFVEALPHEAFSGGFMSRLLFVVQEDTPRQFALPQRPPGHLWEKLRETLSTLRNTKGEVALDPPARKWYENWYNEHKRTPIEDAKFAGYHERKPDHLLRTAILLRVGAAQSLTLMEVDMQRSLLILDWMEASLPKVFRTVATSSAGVTHQHILRTLDAAGGKMPHSMLLRKHQHMMNAREFHNAIGTLIESECVKETKTRAEHYYELVRKP